MQYEARTHYVSWAPEGSSKDNEIAINARVAKEIGEHTLYQLIINLAQIANRNVEAEQYIFIS